LDPITKEILEEYYQKGVTNSSSRKEVLKMVKVCETRVPLLLCQSINSVNGWHDNRLILAKKKPGTEGEKPETKDENKKNS
jgi:hypothetical protein